MRALFTADGLDSYGSIYSTAELAGSVLNFDQAASFSIGCGCPSCMRTALLRDAYGDPTSSGPGKPAAAAALNPAALLTDDIAGDRSTTATLAVDGGPVVSTLNTVGDFDFFKVALKAGETYEFSLLAKAGGPSGVPLADAYVELYDPSGQLVGLSDGGAHTTLNSVNSGFDAALTFTATTDGVYYVNARAFDQDQTNGNKGDFVGDYEVSARQVAANDPTAYRPLYTIDSPLHSIDWGSQVDRTSRNPDGDNGPRDNGAAAHGVVYNPTFDVSGKTSSPTISPGPATCSSTRTRRRRAPQTPWWRWACRTGRKPPSARPSTSTNRWPTSSTSRCRTAPRPTSS